MDIISSVKEFTAGGIGGLSLLAVGHPFDTIRVRVQAQSHLYKNAFHATQKTISKEGPMALYRGVGALVPGIAPQFALMFMGYSHGQSLINKTDIGKKYFHFNNLTDASLAGIYSYLYVTPVKGPSERVARVAQTTNKYGKGSWNVFRNLYKEQGLRGATKGSTMTFITYGTGAMIYFGFYQSMKDKYLAKNSTAKTVPILNSFLYGGAAGSLQWAVIMPLDQIKNRLQSAKNVETSVFEIIGQIRAESKKTGIKAYYRGFAITMLHFGFGEIPNFLKNQDTEKVL